VAEGSELLAAGGVAAAAVLAAFPLVSPLVQIWLLAQKSKEEIEDIVRLKEPLQVNPACLSFVEWGQLKAPPPHPGGWGGALCTL
jgi:hypothetical protein